MIKHFMVWLVLIGHIILWSGEEMAIGDDNPTFSPGMVEIGTKTHCGLGGRIYYDTWNSWGTHIFNYSDPLCMEIDVGAGICKEWVTETRERIGAFVNGCNPQVRLSEKVLATYDHMSAWAVMDYVVWIEKRDPRAPDGEVKVKFEACTDMSVSSQSTASYYWNITCKVWIYPGHVPHEFIIPMLTHRISDSAVPPSKTGASCWQKDITLDTVALPSVNVRVEIQYENNHHNIIGYPPNSKEGYAQVKVKKPYIPYHRMIDTEGTWRLAEELYVLKSADCMNCDYRPPIPQEPFKGVRSLPAINRLLLLRD